MDLYASVKTEVVAIKKAQALYACVQFNSKETHVNMVCYAEKFYHKHLLLSDAYIFRN